MTRVIVLSAFITTLATAQEPGRDADALYAEGVAALEAGQSERALELFGESFRLAPDAERGLALAATLQERGRYSEAIELYDRILDGQLGAVDSERSAAIARARRQADRSRAVLHVRVETDALDVELDGRAMGTVRSGASLTLRLDPGTYRVRGGLRGHFGTTTSIELRQGEQRDLTLPPPAGMSELPDRVDGDEVEERPRQASPPVAPWIVVGLSAVPAAVGIATGVMFNERVDRAEDAGNHRDAQPHLDDARPLGRAANASFAIAGAMAITGLIWGILTRTKTRDRSHHTRVRLGVGVVRGSF